MKRTPFITVLQNTKNARLVREFKDLILATTVVKSSNFCFHFCDIYVLQFPKQIAQIAFIIPERNEHF